MTDDARIRTPGEQRLDIALHRRNRAPLAQIVRAARAQLKSWRTIAAELTIELGDPVTDAALYRWFADDPDIRDAYVDALNSAAALAEAATAQR